MSAVEAINLDEKKYAMTQDVVADSNRSQAVSSASKMTVGEKEKTLKSLVAVSYDYIVYSTPISKRALPQLHR